MALTVEFTHPATGLREEFALPDVKVKTAYNGTQFFPQALEGVLSLNATVPASGSGTSAISSRAMEARYAIPGPFSNMLYGGPGVPNGEFQDQFARLTADVSIAAESLVVDRYSTNFRGPTEVFIIAEGKMLLMHRLPEPGENIWSTGLTNCAAEVVDVAVAYGGASTTIPLLAASGQPLVARFAGAVLVPILSPSASYYAGDGFSYGLVYELERPAPITTLTATDGGTQEIDFTFVRSIHERNAAGTYNGHSGYGVVSHYGIYVLKKGQTGATYAPEGLPEHAVPSQFDSGGQTDAVLAISNAEFVDGATTTAFTGLNRYWDSTTLALTAIGAGTYFVGVVAQNQLARNRDFRGSAVVWDEVVVA